MKRQRGVALLLALVLSLLLGLLAAQVLSEAQGRQGRVSLQRAAVEAFEQAEAALLEGAALLHGALPAPCTVCLPPTLPSAEPGAPWLATASGFVLLQALGDTERAAGVPAGQKVTLVRVTAISAAPRLRQGLEAVYALDDAGLFQRISWRQRLHEG